MELEAYLERIDYRGSREPTLETLTELHRAHMYSVPFENLDIHLGRPIELSLASLFEKIVRRRRGGFCYELNGLFAWLLQQVGFQVEMLSARVFSDGKLGPEFDHMLLRLGPDMRWIADVGFGDSFVEPLLLVADEQTQRGRFYRFVGEGDRWILQRRTPDTDWDPQHAFSLIPRRLEEFRAMCHYQQTSPDSVFTRKSVCSRATPEGRITLSDGRLIVTSGDRRRESAVETVDAYRALIREHFGFDIPGEPRSHRLLQPRS